MEYNVSGATSTANATATPSQEPAASSGGTTAPTGEAGQAATGSDNFVPQGIDVNSLPPHVRTEMERINKEMVRGFTAKTQELAEIRKKYDNYDALRQKAESYDKLTADHEITRLIEDHKRRTEQARASGQTDPGTQKLEAKLQEIENKIQMSELVDVVKSFQDGTNDKGELLHPEFSELNSIGIGKTAQGDEYSLLRACVELSPGETPNEKLENGYKTAKSIRDQIFDEGRKSGMGRMLTKVKNSSEMPTLSTDKTAFNGDAKNLSAREARELARKGVVVS